MMTRHDHLRGYLAAVVGDLAKRKIIRLSDPPTEIVERVIAEFASDIASDIRGVLAEVGITLAENGIGLAMKAGEAFLRERFLKKPAAKSDAEAGKAIMAMARGMGK